MSTIGTLSRHLHFDEFNSVLQTGSGYLSPAQRKAIAIANLGIGAASIFTQPTAATVNASATMTPAQLLTGLITSTTAAAVAATLPLGTDMEIALLAAKGNKALVVGDSFEFAVANTGPNAFTVTTNTGMSVLVGNMIVATGVTGQGTFRVTRTGTGTYSVTRI